MTVVLHEGLILIQLSEIFQQLW